MEDTGRALESDGNAAHRGVPVRAVSLRLHNDKRHRRITVVVRCAIGGALMLTAHCPVCGRKAEQKQGTISRRWECPEHGNIGGDKVVDWRETL